MIMKDVLFYQLFLHQYSNRRFVENFVIGDETGVTLNGEVNNHKVRCMHQQTNHQIFFTMSMLVARNLLFG